MVKSKPNAMLKNAATSTLYSGGNKNVMVCAGIQKNGIVLTMTKLTNPFQSILSTTWETDGFEIFSPYFKSKYVSV